MLRLAPFVLLGSVLLAAHCRGQDFDLGDALEDPQPTKKPTSPSKRPPIDDGFDLGDAIPGEDDAKHPATAAPRRPNPGSHDNSGGAFDDLDLIDGKPLPDKPGGGGGRAANPSGGGHDSDSKTSENAEGSQGMLAGIISSVVVAIAGALSSFIAYQKKKLCFKASDQENVNMESQQGIHAEAPVQCTLLQKQ